MAPTPREFFDDETGKIVTPLYVNARDYLRHWQRENPGEYEEIERLKTEASAAPEEAATPVPRKRVETQPQGIDAGASMASRPSTRNATSTSRSLEPARRPNSKAEHRTTNPRQRETAILKDHLQRQKRRDEAGRRSKSRESVNYQVVKTARR
jgi:hypothetical protein